MALPRELALDDDQLEELMSTSWNLRIATIGPGTRINLTPMWFGWVGGKVYIFGRGQKVVNLRRNPECSVIVDRNERFPELQAATFQGKAVVLEDAAAERAEPDLARARVEMGRKYNGGHAAPVDDPPPNGSTAKGRNRRWIVFTPERSVSWDNFKLGRLRAQRGERGR